MKKQLLSCCLAALGLTAIQAQSFNEWKDPEVNSVNRSAMHTNYFAFASADEAKAGIKENSTNFMTLNGLWKFNWVRHADARPTNFTRLISTTKVGMTFKFRVANKRLR